MGRDSQGDQGGRFRKEGSKLTGSGVNTTFVKSQEREEF